MTDLTVIAAALGIGFFVAFTIGANDETMSPAVGAGLVSVTIAAVISGIKLDDFAVDVGGFLYLSLIFRELNDKVSIV